MVLNSEYDMFAGRRWMLTLFCLLGALACYAAGVVQGALLLLALGLALEAWFWIRIFNLDRSQRSGPPRP